MVSAFEDAAVNPSESLSERHRRLERGIVHEGEECPTCMRRVPKKRKATTPTSAVFSTRMPVEEKEAFEEIVEATAKHLGVYEASYWKWAVLLKAMVIALQGPAEE